MWSQNLRLVVFVFYSNSLLIFSSRKFIGDTKQILVPEFNYLFSNILNVRGNFVSVKRFKTNDWLVFNIFWNGNCIWALNLLTGYFHNVSWVLIFHFPEPIKLYYYQIEAWKNVSFYCLDYVYSFIHLNFQFIRIFFDNFFFVFVALHFLYN